MQTDFSKKLKSLRQEKNLSQQELADKLEMSRGKIGHFETGRNEPSIDEIVKISNFFGCTIDYLLDPLIPKDHILYKNGIDNNKYNNMLKEIKNQKNTKKGE